MSDETEASAMKRGLVKFGFKPKDNESFEVFTGYVYDPRQTDNAWVDGKTHLLFLNEKDIAKTDPKSNASWHTLNDELINKLYSTNSFLLRKGLQYLVNNNIVQEEIIAPILEKSG